VSTTSFATGTVSGTSVDDGAATTAGASAYINCTVMPSGTATFAVQDSANNTDFLDVTGLVFTALTAPGHERKATASGATIRRYVRVQCTGVHGTATAYVTFKRN
jgi:hypothetical protein